MAGIVQRHALARTVRAVAQEVTLSGTVAERAAQFGDPAQAKFAGGGSFRVLEGFTVESEQAREPRIDSRQMRGHRQRLPRRTTTTATFQTYIDLRGTAAPEQAVLLKSAFGSDRAITANEDDMTPALHVFELADTPPALDLLFESEGVLSEGVYGWGCDQLTIAMPNAEEPTFEFTGPARFNASTAQAAGTVGANLVTFVPAINAAAFDVGSFITTRATTDPGLVRVTARNLEDGTLTTTAAATTVAGQSGFVTLAALPTGPQTIVPWTPYEEDTDQFPRASRPSFTAQNNLWIGPGIDDGTTPDDDTFTVFDMQEGEITLNNNLITKEPASSETITDFCADYRDVGGTITFFAGQQELVHKVISKTFSDPNDDFREITRYVRIRMGGNVPGAPYLLIDMPRVQFDRSALDLAQGALGSFTLPYMALARTDLTQADNEIKFTYGTKSDTLASHT